VLNDAIDIFVLHTFTPRQTYYI